MQGDLEEQINNNTQLLAENSQKQVELKLKEDEIEFLKQELFRVNKVQIFLAG
jgi:predicted nuclease with TOPRIM domain